MKKVVVPDGGGIEDANTHTPLILETQKKSEIWCS